MNMIPTRKKQPENVKRRILDAAAAMAVNHGLAAITLDGVAKAAGVSKGGLLHHYATRQALVESLFADILARLEAVVTALIEGDSDRRGRFTRAYVTAVSTPGQSRLESKLLGACSLAMSMEPGLAAQWAEWTARCLSRHGEEDSVTGRLVRYAADGIWLEDATGAGATDAAQRAAVTARLIELTKTI